MAIEWSKNESLAAPRHLGTDVPSIDKGKKQVRVTGRQLIFSALSFHCNLFCYGQVDSPYGSGDFIRELNKLTDEHDNLVLSEIESKEGIYDSIKTFLGKGR